MNQEETVRQTIDHLFRHESSKLISILTKYFGTENFQLAEDVVQDTLIKAMEIWKLRGIPNNPTAWLLTASKNRALDHLRRARHHQVYAQSLSPLLKSEYTAASQLEHLLDKPSLRMNNSG